MAEIRSLNGYTFKDEVARNAIETLSAGITPEQYGAAGDGIADDSAALNEATKQAADQHKTLVLGGNKTYRIETFWDLPSNATVEGNGAVILTDEVQKMGWQASAIRIAGADADNYVRNVSVKNIVIRAADTCPTRYMLQTLRCADVKLSNITFDCQPNKLDRCCLDMYGLCDNFIVENCVFNQLSACKEGGIWVRGGWQAGQVSRNIRFINCDFYKLGGDEVFAIWSWKGTLHDVLISGCHFYQIDRDDCEYYPAWFITLGQSITDAYVRMENSVVHATRSSTVFRMVGDGTNAVVDNCEIWLEQPEDMPSFFGANPMLAQGNGDVNKTIVQNSRIHLRGDDDRTLCYAFGSLHNNFIDAEIGVGPSSTRSVIGNTFIGKYTKGLFWDCRIAKNNYVDAETSSVAWMSGGTDLSNNVMTFSVKGDSQGSPIFHNNWGSGRICNNFITLNFETFCDLRMYTINAGWEYAQYIQDNTIIIANARYTRLPNFINGLLYRKNNSYNGLPEAVFECEGVSFDEAEITQQYKKYMELKPKVLPDNCTDPVKFTWANDDGAIRDMGTSNYQPIKNGSAVVTVNCGKYSATQKVNVNLVPVACESVTLSRSEIKCGNGMNNYLKAFIVPYWTTDDPVWASDAEDVLTVTQDGELTGVKIGTANVTVTCGTKSATCAVSVVDPSELEQYADGEWVLDGTAAYIPLPNLTKDHSVYCNFEILTDSVKNGEEMTLISTGLSGSEGTTPIRIALGKVGSGYPTFRWYTTDVDANEQGKTTLHKVTYANNSFEEIASAAFLYLMDGVANANGSIIWGSELEEVDAGANTGVLSINVKTDDADRPVTDFATSAALLNAINKGEIAPTAAKGFKIRELIVFANGLYSTVEEFKKYRESAEIDLRFDADGNPINAGTSGAIIWSGAASSGDIVAVDSITLDKSTLELENDGTATLTATVLPANATDKTVRWTAAPTGIVTVVNGVVTAQSAGECVITATAGEKTATCAATVKAAQTPDTDKLLYELAVERTFTSANSEYIDTGLKLFENAATVSPQYTLLFELQAASDIVVNVNKSPSIMHCYDETGDTAGLTAAIWGNGKTMVGYNGASVEMNGSLAGIKVKTRYAIQIDGLKVRLGWSDQIGTWQTGANALANVSETLLIGAARDADGTIKRFFDGTLSICKIYGRLLSDSELNAFLQNTEQIDATGISLNENSLSVEVGKSKALTATLTPAGATSAVTWTVSPEGFAAVAEGRVMGVAAGNCTVTATANGHSATCAVTVVESSGTSEIIISTTTKSKAESIWQNNAPMTKSIMTPFTAKANFKLKKLDYIQRLTADASLAVEIYNKTDGATVETVTVAATEGDFNVIAEYSNVECKAGKEYQLWINTSEQVMCYPYMPDNIATENDYFTTTGTEYRWNNANVRYMGDVTIEI